MENIVVGFRIKEMRVVSLCWSS